ncbi:MAG TPA: hypothetical protein DCM86_01985 [Verrucomicrobiales bacterium]|nr:hypothetical protein [Verrucomicrobiales bacterium]
MPPENALPGKGDQADAPAGVGKLHSPPGAVGGMPGDGSEPIAADLQSAGCLGSVVIGKGGLLIVR